MSNTTEEINARSEMARESGYDRFMRQDTTKFMIGLIPSCDTPETLETLLKSAYCAGFSSGEGVMAGEMLQALLKPKPGT